MTQAIPNQDSSPSIFSLLFAVWVHLSRRRRLQLIALLLVMLASGLAELVSLGSILPFLSALGNPEELWEQQPILQTLALKIGYDQPQQILFPITVAFVLSVLLSAVIRLLNLWLNGQLAAAVGSDLSCEAYRRTLYQPYQEHVQRNSADVISVTTTQINITVAALNATLQLATSFVVAIALFAGLLLIDWQIAISSAVVFGSAYGVVATTTNQKLRRNSLIISEFTTKQLKSLQEGLGAIRDVLLDNNQETYLRIYRQADRPLRQFQAKNVFMTTFPRYALEAVGMVAIAIFGLLLVSQRGSGLAVIPLLGTMALGAQRLLPALQQIYSGWANLKGFSASIQAVMVLLNQQLPANIHRVECLPLSKNVCLEKVSFRYPECQNYVLRQLDLEILRGERIGLIGMTGSGKSTLVDVLMGLLPPCGGRLLVDGVDIHDPCHAEYLMGWRAAVAHVPQSIYLADSSIAENIAFGVPKHAIDFEEVRRAAQQAQIADFIESCADGYMSFVGERGVRLSGGQRQRIGIARALYKQAAVIVLDEATSALDTHTEKVVMEAVEGLSRNLTLVMIAHRLSTVQRCDRVIRLESGSIIANGPPSLILPTEL